MPPKLDLLSKLKTSWTKYDIVQVIDIVANNEIEKYIKKESSIDEPILRSFLGVKNLTEPIPNYWIKIQNYPEQKRLFALLAALFTHHSIIDGFANNYSTGDMRGVYVVAQEGIKQLTNIRSALVESQASEPLYRRRKSVPYDLSKLFQNVNVGPLFKEVLKERLTRVGYENVENDSEFYAISYLYNFHKVFSLSKEQYKQWLEGTTLDNPQVPVDSSWLRKYDKYNEIIALPVNQWLEEWDKVNFFEGDRRSKPNKQFLLFKIPAKVLRRLSTVQRRETTDRRSDDIAIQRQHTSERSLEISRYVVGGFPWSVLPTKKRESEDFNDLRMPGWLPTAIIANIIAPDAVTKVGNMKRRDSIGVSKVENSDLIKLQLPQNWNLESWNPDHYPIEIIDGQHRLLALDNIAELDGDFELPVVAFFDLDITWQAYLFYTINIKPKRINKSLAYDLYPLLRVQDWLEKETDSTEVYRETRAQELTEILWMHPDSPWKNRINMLGDPKEGSITQAAFLRSLTSSYVKSWEQNTNKIGGLFGARLTQTSNEVLDWSRTQQAAFLILVWQSIEQAVKKCEYTWAKDLRKKFKQQFDFFDETIDQEPAFVSKNSLLTTDQGVRGILQITNDIFYVGINELKINSLEWDQFSYREEENVKIDYVTSALNFLKQTPINQFIIDLSNELMSFDWRTSSTDGLTNEEKLKQMIFRGSGGYKELRRQLINLLSVSTNKKIFPLASKVKTYLEL